MWWNVFNLSTPSKVPNSIPNMQQTNSFHINFTFLKYIFNLTLKYLKSELEYYFRKAINDKIIICYYTVISVLGIYKKQQFQQSQNSVSFFHNSRPQRQIISSDTFHISSTLHHPRDRHWSVHSSVKAKSWILNGKTSLHGKEKKYQNNSSERDF